MGTNLETRKQWWHLALFALFIFLVFAGLALVLAGCQTASGVMAASPPLPALPLLPVVRVSAVRGEAVTNVNGTNVVVCFTNRVTGVYQCVTNPAPPPPAKTMITLAWTEPGYFTGAPFKLGFTNHLLWSTNGPNGPWTGDVAVTCTNKDMFINVPINPRAGKCFYRLGTNTF